MRAPGKMPEKAGSEGPGNRDARLAEALRENLRRRKSQERARKRAGGTDTAVQADLKVGLDESSADGARDDMEFGRESGRDARNVPHGGD